MTLKVNGKFKLIATVTQPYAILQTLLTAILYAPNFF